MAQIFPMMQTRSFTYYSFPYKHDNICYSINCEENSEFYRADGPELSSGDCIAFCHQY